MSLEEMITKAVEETVRRVVREELRASGPAVLSTAQAAELAGVSAKTVRAWISEGRLPSGLRGQKRTIRRDDLERFLSGEKDGAGALLRRVG